MTTQSRSPAISGRSCPFSLVPTASLPYANRCFYAPVYDPDCFRSLILIWWFAAKCCLFIKLDFVPSSLFQFLSISTLSAHLEVHLWTRTFLCEKQLIVIIVGRWRNAVHVGKTGSRRVGQGIASEQVTHSSGTRRGQGTYRPVAKTRDYFCFLVKFIWTQAYFA